MGKSTWEKLVDKYGDPKDYNSMQEKSVFAYVEKEDPENLDQIVGTHQFSDKWEYKGVRLEAPEQVLSKDPGAPVPLRKPKDFNFCELPPNAMREVARCAHYGSTIYDRAWKSCSLRGSDSSLSHAIGHSFQVSEHSPGSERSIQLLAKTAINILFQLELELKREKP